MVVGGASVPMVVAVVDVGSGAEDDEPTEDVDVPSVVDGRADEVVGFTLEEKQAPTMKPSTRTAEKPRKRPVEAS